MTDVLNVIKARRATKVFDSSYKLSDDELTALLDAARYAPTAFNIQNYRFVVVRDNEQRQKISDAAFGQPQITTSSALIILCADVKAWAKDPSRYWKNAPEEVCTLYAEKMIPGFYNGREQMQRDEAFRSCGLAAYALMMAAQAQGLDTCPMIGFDFDKVKEIINLPEDHELVMFVAIGKGAQPSKPRSGMLALDELVRYESFEEKKPT